MANLVIDYEYYLKLCYKLLDDIRKQERTYQAILCPLRGGFFLSYFMSNHLKLPIRYLEISSYTGMEQGDFHIGLKPDLDNGPFLLCDDIYDSGNTIRKILEIYHGIEFDVAVLLSKKPDVDILVGQHVAAE
jgi:hypoxanthine phosphoribosyltransferase